MDFFKLSQAGVLTEYEIKISRSDYFSDFDKKRSYHDNGKHEKMKQRICKANKFYFVVPDGLIKEDEVPEYAGLLTYDRGSIRTIKNAPVLHKNKYEGKELVSKLASRCNDLQMKFRNRQYEKEKLEKRIESLKETIRQFDSKHIQLYI